MKGTLQDVSLTLNGKMRLTFEVDRQPSGVLDKLKDKTLDITAKAWREKRSLDANRYYWQLIGKLSDALKLSTTELHNMMIADYGQFEIMDNRLVNIILLDSIEWMKLSYIHLKPTTAVKTMEDGNLYRVYRVMRGSHTYDSKEMSTLIEGLVRACREQGIETITDAERLKMYEEYAKRHDR